MGALLASDKIDWTALRQGTALRLPKPVGNIIWHPRPESCSLALAHMETRTGANQLLLASVTGQQRDFSCSATPIQASPAQCRKGQVHFINSICK